MRPKNTGTSDKKLSFWNHKSEKEPKKMKPKAEATQKIEKLISENLPIVAQLGKQSENSNTP